MLVIKAASRVGSRLIRLSAIAMAAAVSLTGCTSTQYMGISLRPGGADPTMQALATRASVGDKQAQLDLGIRFFEGDGVDVDTRRACRLFRMSASDTAGQLWIYTPSPGGGAPSQVIPIASTTPAYGLQAARDWSDRCNS